MKKYIWVNLLIIFVLFNVVVFFISCPRSSDAKRKGHVQPSAFVLTHPSPFAATKVKAEAGDATAQHNLGVMYRDGGGGLKDLEEAVKWTRKAAEQGYADAQNNLGAMYRDGQGVEQDFKEAVKWYQKAADQGLAKAQSNLGVMYEKGQGVQKDATIAYAWWNIATANGNATAKKNKGIGAKRMTANQIAEGQKLSKEMINKNPKLIN